MKIILNNTKPKQPLKDGENVYEVKNLLDANDVTTIIGTKYELECYIDELTVANENGIYQYDEIYIK